MCTVTSEAHKALRQSVAVPVPQNWCCDAPKPLWSSRLPIPIKSPHKLMKLSNMKISSHIISYHEANFWFLSIPIDTAK